MAPSRFDSFSFADSRPGAFPGLAALLWTVREALENVLYELVMVRLVVTDGSARWLPRADEGLQQALEGLRSVEVLRAAEVDELTLAVHKPGRTTLEALLKVAPDPWPTVFEDHRDALRLLMTEIDAAVAENKRVLKTSQRRNRMPASCGRDNRNEAAVTAAAAYRSAAATLETVPQLSLQEFLG